ncbi:MAG: 4Fe-4S dicluster domain-containing protein [Bacteroidales bacterium]|nr:4Fe-4S dicluster domain-containing protein [Bacteroidales bacterium]MDD4670184.1 4Fe-4S dicluster domain-containing protein [Bacteroidales bacterium]
MKWKNVRVLRIVIALIFFATITLSFLFFSAGKLPFSHLLDTIQFGPAFMAVFVGSALPFIALLLLTIICGRVYCSFICPLGIWQDIVIWIAARFKSKQQRRFKYRKPNVILRFGILIIIALCLIIGISYPFALFDPYSIYGRIATNIFNGAVQGINNGLSSIFPASVSYMAFSNITVWTFVVASAFFCLVTILSAFWGRMYCNTVCPVGCFLGLIGEHAMFRLQVNESKCKECGLCGLYCKSECLDSKNKYIDYSRCVVCFDCAKSCREGALEYRFAWKKSKTQNSLEKGKIQNPGRRDAIFALGTMGAILASRKWGRKIHPAKAAEEEKEGSLIPPGAVSIDHLKEHCTACQACIAACPSKIIHPSITEHGIDGFMMPVITYKKHFCSYDCNACSQACPNGALKHISLEEKQLTQIGKVQFTAKNCIVFKEGTDCGACDEHCPTKAITMLPHKKKPGLYFPSVNKNICIGCGGCEYVCPASPKAMRVIPNEIHEAAQKPTVDKQEDIKVKDFGF